jgi:hypothetical protein
MADSKLQLTDLDFDNIKSNLKDYLKGQSEFQDFDFEGSALNVLLDLLSYNTFYNSFYMNMVANEMFLDTAVLRSSVVSHAKLLGYTPRSAIASLAYLNVSIKRAEGDTTSIINIPALTQFAAKGKDTSAYSFYTVDDSEYVSANAAGYFSFTSLMVKEGLPVTKTFTYDLSTNPEQYFDLTDENIDTSTLKVIVQTSATNPSYNVFSLAEDATTVSTNSNVYYLEESSGGSYRIYFGDDVLGRKLDDRNLVAVSYLTTNKENGNGCRSFSLQTQILAGSVATVSVVDAGMSSGGSGQEDIQNVKFTAPKSFIAQNRAVTKNDYISLIDKKYPYFDSVTVWGGDEETPPVYGKIYISAKPKDGFTVTKSQQQHLIKDIIKPISVLTVTPEYIDADYNYMNFKINCTYNPKQTYKSAAQLQTLIRSAVSDFANTNLNVFDGEFQYSKFLRALDLVDQSIQSSSATIYLQKRFLPDLTKSQSYIIKYQTPLNRGTLNDRLYSSPYFVMSDVNGIPQKCYLEEVPFSFGGIDQIKIDNSGSGYTSTPTLTISGDGKGANAYAVIINGAIQSVVVDNIGAEYTTAAVSVTGGGGRGGALSAVLEGSKGTLRTYYFDSNESKKILNDKAGTVYYSNGTVTLESFDPVEVGGDFQVLSIYAQPETYALSSKKNIILTQDNADQASIIVNAIPITR